MERGTGFLSGDRHRGGLSGRWRRRRETAFRVVPESFFSQRLEGANLVIGSDTKTVERERVLEPGQIDEDEKSDTQLVGCDKMSMLRSSILCHVSYWSGGGVRFSWFVFVPIPCVRQVSAQCICFAERRSIT